METLRVRVRTTSAGPYGVRQPGDIVGLPVDEAITLIVAHYASPALGPPALAPALPPDGCTLREAIRCHVEADPNVTALLEAIGDQWAGRVLHVQAYREPPEWGGLPRSSPRTRLKDVWVRDPETGVRIAKPPRQASPDDRCRRACLGYFIRAAYQRFLGRLARGDLDWDGVPEASAPTLDRIAIPAGWLERDAVLDLAKDELWEIVTRTPKHRERRFSDVRVVKRSAVAIESCEPGGPDGITIVTSPEGFTPEEALWRLTDPRKREEYVKVKSFWAVISYADGEAPEEQRKWRARKLWAELCDEIYSGLRAGDLVAFGFSGSVSVSGNPDRIAPNRWATLRFEGGNTIPPSLTDTAKMPGLTVYSVRIFRAEDMAPAGGTIGAITRCEQWLSALAEDGPPQKAKGKYCEEALLKFTGLTRRGFDTAWRKAVGDNPDWTKPGRKPRRNKE